MLLVLAYVLIFHLCIIWDQDVQGQGSMVCGQMQCLQLFVLFCFFSSFSSLVCSA